MTLSVELFLKVRTSEGVGVVDRPAIELRVAGVAGVAGESPRLGFCIVGGDDGKSQPCAVIWYELLSPIFGLMLSGRPLQNVVLLLVKKKWKWKYINRSLN